MTSRERITAALNHRQSDRTPIFEYVLLSPIADVFLGREYVDFADQTDKWLLWARDKGWEQSVRQYAIDRLDLAEALGHDMMYVVPNPLPSELKSAGNSGKIEHIDPFSGDPVESVRRRTQQAEESFAGPPTDSFLVYQFLKEEMSRRGMDLPILAPAYQHGVWTDVDLMQTMVLEPEVARQHFALATKRSLLSIEKYIELGIDQVGVGGDFAGNRPLISPSAYREFIMPEVAKLSRRIHEAGLKAVNASDGDLWPVIDDFLIGCEVDAYLEIDMSAGMDLRKLKEAYGDRITFYGNMDCGQVMSFASEDEVRTATLDCLQAGLGDGGHIFCCSNAITASVPLKNYVSMVNAYREMFGLTALQP